MDASLGMGEHGLGQAVPGFALGEAGLAFHPQPGVLDPVQHEERPFDPPDLAKREMEPVLLPVGPKLAQHVRGLYGPGFDTGSQSGDVAPPVIKHDAFIDRPAHDRAQVLPASRLAEAGETPVREVAQARHEDESEKVEKREDVIGHAAGVDGIRPVIPRISEFPAANSTA